MMQRDLNAINAFKEGETLDPSHREHLRKAVGQIWNQFTGARHSEVSEEEVERYLDSVMIACMGRAFAKPDEQG